MLSVKSYKLEACATLGEDDSRGRLSYTVLGHVVVLCIKMSHESGKSKFFGSDFWGKDGKGWPEWGLRCEKIFIFLSG